jgi:hypothetical protein
MWIIGAIVGAHTAYLLIGAERIILSFLLSVTLALFFSYSLSTWRSLFISQHALQTGKGATYASRTV